MAGVKGKKAIDLLTKTRILIPCIKSSSNQVNSTNGGGHKKFRAFPLDTVRLIFFFTSTK